MTKDKQIKCYSFKKYLAAEVLKKPISEFSWFKAIRKARRSTRPNFLFWYRLSYLLYRKHNRFCKSLAKSINDSLIKKYSCDIGLGAQIDIGFDLAHTVGIVITNKAIIGKNFYIRQNTTIGDDGKSESPIIIGDNVSIGANSCIIGSGLKIGSNSTIGAMSFVNKGIPNETIHVTVKEHKQWVNKYAKDN